MKEVETYLIYASEYPIALLLLTRSCADVAFLFLRTSAQWSISNSLLLATIIRIGFVVITYGCKVPAGIFVPSMAIGATFGRMVGIAVKAMYR